MISDASELRELAVDLEKAAWRTLPAVSATVAKGASNIKDRMREEAQSSGSYKHFHRSIGYDLAHGGLAAEIGPDKDGPQGALGNILYFGTSKNSPVLDIESGIREEAPRFERFVAEAAVRSMDL